MFIRLFTPLRLIWLGLGLLALSTGCGSESATAPSGTATVDGAYRVSLTFEPARPVPDQPTRLTAHITRDGAPVERTNVLVSAETAGDSISEVALDNDGGGDYSGELAFPAGDWIVRVTVRPPSGFSDYAEFPTFVSCAGGGEAGDACCAEDDCGSALVCVAGACADELAVDGGLCFGDAECATGNCESGVCRPAPACDDGRANGSESDIDCGGECGPCLPGAACADDADCEGPCLRGVCTEGLEILGNGGHTTDDVEMTEVKGGMRDPMDLEFHPDRTEELWVVNQGNNSMWIGTDVGRGGSNGRFVSEDSGDHFMVFPASLAFGDSGCTSTISNRPSTDLDTGRCLATIHETDQPTPYTNNAPGTFMGPTLWTGDSQMFDAGHASHFDMLHNSPNGMGIAWEDGNTYWVFDGYHSSITRYKFTGDHGPGGASHSDGDVARFVAGQVSRVANVPSHLEFDRDTDLLFIADTGNNRVAVLDTTSGSRGGRVGPNYDGTAQYEIDGASLSTLVEGDDIGLEQPSGLAIHDDTVFVSDHATGRILALTKDGELIDWLDTGLGQGALKGIAFHPESGDLYFVDAKGQRVMKVTPKSE